MYQMSASPHKKTRTAKEVGTFYRNIVLDGVKTLSADKVTATYKVTREVDPNKGLNNMLSKEQLDESNEHMQFKLVEITPTKLVSYREKKIPSFVLKVDGKLYHTRIPKGISFLSTNLLGTHMCGKECCRQSPASDEAGGCGKVRNNATFIERYPWITKGYETFGTRTESFVVVECSHYQRLPSGRLSYVPEKEKEKIDWLLKTNFR